jgi:hypothetical protein
MEAAKGMSYLLAWHGLLSCELLSTAERGCTATVRHHSNNKVEPGRRYSQPMLLSIYSLISLLKKAFINGKDTKVFVSESTENQLFSVQDPEFCAAPCKGIFYCPIT